MTTSRTRLVMWYSDTDIDLGVLTPEDQVTLRDAKLHLGSISLLTEEKEVFRALLRQRYEECIERITSNYRLAYRDGENFVVHSTSNSRKLWRAHVKATAGEIL